MHPGRRRQGSGFALLLLASQLFRVGFDRIPPVTLVAILVQVATFMRLGDIEWPTVDDVCVSSVFVWHYGYWSRLLLASFFHLDDWHLYYNMVSFLWKGLTLERLYGSGYFAFVIAVFSVLTNAVLVALNIVIGEHLLHDSSYILQCAAGFSGVIFALKVLTTYNLPPGTHYIMGWLPVPSRYAMWAELVVIQILVPRTSFTGHLAGILVGLLYVKGPLKFIMDMLYGLVAGFASGGRVRESSPYGGHGESGGATPRYTHGRQYYNQSGTSGRASSGTSGRASSGATYNSGYGGYESSRPQPSAPPSGDDLNQGNTPTASRLYPDLGASFRGPPYPPEGDTRGMPYPQAPDMETMRRTRLNRFDNRPR